MNYRVCYIVLMMFFAVDLIAESPVVVYPIARYEHIYKNNPFIEDSTDILPGDESQSFILVGIISCEGKEHVLVLNKGTGERMIVGEEQNYDGFALKSLKIEKDPANTVAVLDRFGEEIVIKYSKENIAELRKDDLLL